MAYCLIHSSGSHFKAFLYVKATPGATVTATGPKVFSGIADNSGNVMIEIKRKGTYSVTSGASGATIQSVPILKSKDNYYTNVTGAFTLTISRQNRSNKDFATISVSRSSSPYGPSGTSTGTLSNGDTVYYGDVLTATATASTGFTSPSVGMSGSIEKVGNTYVVGGNCTLIGQANPIAVKLTLTSKTINNLTAATASLKRVSSPYQNAQINVNVNAGNGALYYGDTFTVASTTGNSSAYNTAAPTVNGHVSVSNSTYTVGTGDISVTANASVKSYTLTLTAGTNVTTKVSWSSSDYAGKSGEIISKNNSSGTATIYYGDKLTITNTASTNYSASYTVDAGNINSVSGNVTISSSATASKVTIKIYNRNDHIFTFDVYPGNVTWRSQIVASGSYAGMTYAWHPNWSWTSYDLTSSKYMEKVYFYCGGNINNNDVLPVKFNFRYYYVNSDYDVEGNGILYKDQARTQQLNDNETIAGGTYYGALT